MYMYQITTMYFQFDMIMLHGKYHIFLVLCAVEDYVVPSHLIL